MTEHPSRIGVDGPLHECAYCAALIPEKASKCSQCGEWVRKPVGLLLGLAIFVAPALFAWFTLGKSRSSAARILAFSWLGFLIFLFLFSSTQGIALRQSQRNTQAATLPSPARPEKAREPRPHERAMLAEIAARKEASIREPTVVHPQPVILTPRSGYEGFGYREFVKNIKTVTIGMTSDQVRAILGPTATWSTQRSGGSHGTHEQWTFMFSSYYSVYLFFEDGILTSWQESG